MRNQIAEVLSKQADHVGIQYREPFFGGGSIGMKLLNDNPDISNIWINDKDIGIASLWTSVIRYVDDLQAQVRDFKPSVQAFYDIKAELMSLQSMPKQKSKIVDIGFKKLAIHQISYSGLGTKSGGPLGGEKQQSQYKIDCRWSPEYICKKAKKLHEKFAGIAVHEESCTNLDFADVVNPNKQDSIIYLDPPYYVKGNDLYQHGFTKEQHERLAEVLKASTHAWVLSYDDCPEIREMYSWAAFQSVTVKYSITATKDAETGDRMSTAKPELLIYPKRKEVSEVANVCMADLSS